MKNIALICEYNPFHKGHSDMVDYIYSAFGSDCNIIALMSGNFVQRGDASVYEKYQRAKSAVLSGVSLVLELPFPYSSSPGEIFAQSGVSILERIGNIDYLVFGSESGDIEYLTLVSERLSSRDFSSALDSAISENKDKPYLKIKSDVYKNLYGEEIPSQPNDILGVEYITALKKLASSITPYTYKRHTPHSAGKAREMTEFGDYSEIPDTCRDFIKKCSGVRKPLFEDILLSDLRKKSASELSRTFDMPTDLAYSIFREVRECHSYGELLSVLDGSGYTFSRTRRCILYSYFGIEEIKKAPDYTLLLASSEKGNAFLSSVRKTSRIPIITKQADYQKHEECIDDFERSLMADSLYSIICDERKSPADLIRQSPFIKK